MLLLFLPGSLASCPQAETLYVRSGFKLVYVLDILRNAPFSHPRTGTPFPLFPFSPPFTKYHRRQNAQVNSQALQRRLRRFRPPRTNSSPDRWLSPIIQRPGMIRHSRNDDTTASQRFSVVCAWAGSSGIWREIRIDTGVRCVWLRCSNMWIARPGGVGLG